MRQYIRLAVIAGFVAIAADEPASAQSICTGNLGPEQIVGCLAPAPKLKVRAFPGTLGTRGVSIEGEEAPVPPAEVNLSVNFEFNSAELTNDGMIALDALGKALSDPSLQSSHFRIAGHTDAVGGDAYNQKLSEQRAAAVRAYLASHFQLDPTKFEVIGYGRSKLLDAADPTSAVNRRVRITRL